MGQRGPVPDRSENWAREGSRRGKDQPTITKGTRREVTIPEPDPEWHPIAKMLWNSLTESGQSDFYQSSDWAYAFSICDDLSMYKKPNVTADGDEYHRRSAQMLQTIMASMSNLLVTEADRRRVQIELDEPDPGEDPASVAVMDSYRQGLEVHDGGKDDNEEDPNG